MPIRNNHEVFVTILSRARKNSAQSAEVYRQFSAAAESFELKRDLETFASVTENDVNALDHCFERIGEKPVNLPFRLEDAFAPGLEAEIEHIQTSTARQLYILFKVNEQVLRSIVGYSILISEANETGRYNVSEVLQAILARRIAFIQQNHRLAQSLIERKIAEVGGSAALHSAA